MLPIAAAVFVAMLVFPVIGSYLIYKRTTVDVLYIDADKTRDPRFFAKSFRDLIDAAFGAYEGGDTVALSRSAERFYLTSDDADLVAAASSSLSDAIGRLPENCDRLVVALEDTFDSGAVSRFDREVYVCGNALIGEECALRALYALGSVSLGRGVFVDRWVDAESVLAVYDDCDLGVSASSAQHLIIGRNCRFRRLFAPIIDVGTYADELVALGALSRAPFVSREVIWGARDVGRDDRDESYDDETAGDEGVVVGTIISSHNVKLLENIVLAGDIRSHGSVRLCDGAVVFGNVFAESGVVIGEGCRVFGTVFCQEDVHVGDGAVLGTEGQQRSVVARGRVIFEGRARVFGYVTTEGGGLIVPDEETGDEPDSRPKRSIAVVPDETPPSIVAKPTADEVAAGVSWRKDDRVVGAVLPVGAASVGRSMFYACRKLARVELPPSIERIEDFAFFGCESLTEIDLSSCMMLREIGEAAFEGCTSLRTVRLPSSIRSIGEAAFRNCRALVDVRFVAPSSLRTVASHAFAGCSSLAAIELPPAVEHVGASAFFECVSLAELVLPSAVRWIGPYCAYGCTSLAVLSVPRELTDDERIGLPEGARLEVRSDAVAPCDGEGGLR